MADYSWRTHVHAIANQEVADFLKIAQLTQAILESGRGTSHLFLRYGNPYGIKYRAQMYVIADPVIYQASDGTDTYCRFKSEQDAVVGYWVFINRRVYEGWRLCENEHEFISHIVDCGYVGESAPAQSVYKEKIFSLFPEARHILAVV